MNVLYFDTETTGLPRKDATTGQTHQPNITQFGFILEINGTDALVVDTLIKPENWFVHEDPTGQLPPSIISHRAMEVTGITPELCEEFGIPIADAMELFIIAAEHADVLVCHNTAFDMKVVAGEYARLQPRAKDPEIVFAGKPSLCTMKASTPICRIPKKDRKTGYKWPKLEEAMLFFFDEALENAHSAIVDIKATRRLFHKLVSINAFDKDIHRLSFAGKLDASFLDGMRQAA